ncbi:hypothetical protein FisN_13Hh234 [Fistulifera solaris]|uniref:Uncharacterized protein n=1 Tax=Fistulifera solaris TaxID=1519565 RepID=A0A1Z5KNT1_FISSO|nr:hypothetical protein FisN_13Hh234 [Fistulifera solaris]|eukprot:GAX27671.1 hypothetical protein FisN_13Hh234 [Fistulifera solaris]
MRLISRFFLFALAVTTTFAQEGVIDSDCDTSLGVVTKEQLLDLAAIFLEPLVENPEVSRNVIFRPAKYDFMVMKLCSSCRFIDNYYIELGESFPADWLTYCSEDIYGYDKFQSALVMFPLEPNSNGTEILQGYELRPFLSLSHTVATPEQAPTNVWPKDFTTFLSEVDSAATFRQVDFSTFVPSMLAASAGSVAIIPDYVGYGTSLMNRTLFWGPGYKQAAFVSWLRVREYLQKETPCTTLDLDHVTVQGFEDGAFGAMEVAQGFRRFRTLVLRVFSGAGILDLDQYLVQAVLEASNGRALPDRMKSLLEMAAFSFSWGNPNLVNTGTGQDLVSPTLKQQIMSTYTNTHVTNRRELQGSATVPTTTENTTVVTPENTTVPTTENTTVQEDISLGAISAATVLDFLNPNLITFYEEQLRNGNRSPCKATAGIPTTIDKLCEAIASASVYPTLLGQTEYNWIHSVEFCYSETDNVVSQAQVEVPDLINMVEFAQLYDGPIGEESDALKPLDSDHQVVMEICGMGTGLFYGLQGHRPEDPELRADTLSPVNSTLAQVCGIEVPDTPVAAPSDEVGGNSSNPDGGTDEDGEGSGDTDEDSSAANPTADNNTDGGGGGGSAAVFYGSTLITAFVGVAASFLL